jgi:hypothetical protein
MHVRKGFGEYIHWDTGDRVEIHPGSDLWMRGARFGTVRKVKNGKVAVRMDHKSVRKLQWFYTTDLRPAT